MMENPIKMDDLRLPLFLETSIYPKENLFCFFFVIELTVRFGAYQRKISAFRDWEWVVDLASCL